MPSQEGKKSDWLSKKRQMQGAQLSRNEAYLRYAPVMSAIAATQQLASFCDAIKLRPGKQSQNCQLIDMPDIQSCPPK
jgi:hypothetical protein